MQTSLITEFLQTTEGQRANEILRSCVHCGLCNATCPTYQLTGNELDGPRGRIYLIKNHFEEKSHSNTGLKHLDRCLTCLACETTCPSGVQYGTLLDIGRKHIDKAIGRPVLSRLKRHLIISMFSKPARVALIFALARFLKPLLPAKLARKIPSHPAGAAKARITEVANQRKMLTIQGCVQSVAAPQINAATTTVLGRSGIRLDEVDSDCCGALAFHLTDIEKAERTIRQNIDTWYQKLKGEYQYLVITSSGCSNFIKQYGSIMQADQDYAQRAAFVARRCRDLSELGTELRIRPADRDHAVAFHNPCTLQHGQKIFDMIETRLKEAGYTLVTTKDQHLCCGSAGSYSLLETGLSAQLLQNKVACLEQARPDIIATANIGCLMHLQSGTDRPVKHWIELLV